MLLQGPSEPGPSEDANEDTLLKSDGEFESGQRSPDHKRHQRLGRAGRTASPTKDLAIMDTAPQLWERKFRVPNPETHGARREENVSHRPEI